jgi:predicted RNA-binding Zn ribbon-like protein
MRTSASGSAAVGAAALALVNTERRVRHATVDLLATPEALAAWLGEARDLPSRDALPKTPSGMRILMGEAILLRTEIRALFAAVSQGRDVPEPMLHALDRALRASHRSARCVSEAGTIRVVEEEWADAPLAFLSPFARSAAELVAWCDPDRLRECEAIDCPTWFYDASKGGIRRWCSMARCGNRAKAARHRRRQEAID